MNSLLKLLGYRDSKYRGSDFSVCITPRGREGVSVVYTRQGGSLNLVGERIGGKWERIELRIPTKLEATQVSQIVRDLEVAFEAMRYRYVISRNAGIEVVHEKERQAAIAQLNEMGYDVEFLPDGKIRQTPRVGAPRDLPKISPRMISLIQDLHGTRQRFEILARSKES